MSEKFRGLVHVSGFNGKTYDLGCDDTHAHNAPEAAARCALLALRRHMPITRDRADDMWMAAINMTVARWDGSVWVDWAFEQGLRRR